MSRFFLTFKNNVLEDVFPFSMQTHQFCTKNREEILQKVDKILIWKENLER